MLGFRIIKISGHSMEPALKAGSFALVKKAANYKAGEAVLFKIDGQPAMVKRVTYVENDLYFLTGDNIGDSLDSRKLGWIHKNKILGKIIWN